MLPSLIAIALVAPATASAVATLNVNKPCYGPGEEIAFSGGGYTPSGEVAVSVSGRQLGVTTANSVGEIAVSTGAPAIKGKRRTDFYTATDQTNLSLAAGIPVHLTSLNVKVTPKNGNPAKAKRVVARGFTSGKVLWAHVRRGKAKRNVKVGKLKGACKVLDVKRKLFLADAQDGLYNVQFDTKRKYSASTRPQVSFLVTVFHTFKVASASSASESWIQID
ncbi:MAG TPA: hypothetical protein VFQ14_06585 [Thermoleophilaceae bacterium]|nr:hypothetical protein [Thermoleophilaceae bacterium]